MFSGRKGKKVSSASQLPPAFDFFGEDNVANDADLEAELQRIIDNDSAPTTRSVAATRSAVDLDRVNAIAVAVDKAVNKEDEDEDVDVDEEDEELLNELSILADDTQDVQPRQDVRPRQVDQPHEAALPRDVAQVQRDRDIGENEGGRSLLSIIDGRIVAYTKALSNAKASSEEMRARRYKRGLDKLHQMRAMLLKGQPINADELPANIAIVHPIAEARNNYMGTNEVERGHESTSEITSSHKVLSETKIDGEAMTDKAATIAQLQARRQEIKTLALKARNDGNKVFVVEALKAIKQCEQLLEQVNRDEIEARQVTIPDVPVEQRQPPQGVQQPKSVQQPQPVPQQQPHGEVQQPQGGEQQPQAVPQQKPFTLNYSDRSSVQQGLVERLNKFRADSESLKSSNPSKSRRYSRICKQYEEALKMHLSGQKIDLAALPQPLGFAPMVANNNFSEVNDFVSETNEAKSEQIPSASSTSNAENSSAAPPVAPAASASTTAATNAGVDAASAASSGSAAATQSGSSKYRIKRPETVQEKQMHQLTERQRLFKEAALASKQANRMDEAKDYLRQAKGFDKLIQAVQAGLPVDMGTLPIPPQKIKDDVALDFEIVAQEECSLAASTSLSDSDRRTLFMKLETDLIAQIKMCESNIKHFRSTGDVARSNKFQQMCEHAKSDLFALRNSFKRGEPVPKFFYELRAFPKEICNTDLADNDLEISVMQGVNFSLNGGASDGIDTYLKIEFPYPKDTPFRDRSSVVRSTTLAKIDFGYKTLVSVRPKDKSYQRIFKRQSLRVEVWRKVGFLRSDALMGTVLVKLQPLETNCVIHDAFPLMDGRRSVGGKLEIRIRTRYPVMAKQVVKVQERWLVVEFK